MYFITLFDMKKVTRFKRIYSINENAFDKIDSEFYHLRYTGRFSCQRIREWLYKDATIYLKRKYDKFNSF